MISGFKLHDSMWNHLRKWAIYAFYMARIERNWMQSNKKFLYEIFIDYEAIVFHTKIVHTDSTESCIQKELLEKS